jgi:hypothetical protein
VNKIITGLASYTRDDDFLYNLRRLIGLKNGGEIAVIPDINPPPTHPRAVGAPGNYYLNFQNPAGQPTANPLIVNGHTYLKIGGNDYAADTSLGYGWYAPPDVHWLTTYLSSGPNVLQRSILYSDWGRPATFEFDVPNGEYNVTLSVGWQGRTYSHQKADIEGVSFVSDEATTPVNPYLVRTKRVYIGDNKLTLAMGIFDEYTMLNYLDIEAAYVPPSSVTDLRVTSAITDTSTLTATLRWTPLSSAITTTLRYLSSPITDLNWNSAITLTSNVISNSYTLVVPYSNSVTYFALKSQDVTGAWSGLSNNAFWPYYAVFLPVIRR